MGAAKTPRSCDTRGVALVTGRVERQGDTALSRWIAANAWYTQA